LLERGFYIVEEGMPVRSRDIRNTFLGYFNERGHEVVPSSPLVPKGDPTLLFTNAGMVQFKEVFLGNEPRPYKRAVTSQKCLRVSGKHNDLETVGRTARHHTFFEMLGNFSFGDYFKREAIGYAWELLTEVLGLPPERLWATVYRDDDEAYGLWQEVAGVPETRIIRLGEKDNFWAMGDTGPCGPCSELVIDRGEHLRCDAPTCGIGGCDCDRWLELWNLVFMQYDRDETGRMTPLPRPSIDTGMGLERISAILQDTPTNFETDLLRPVIDTVEHMSGLKYAPGPQGFPFRVITDHIRSLTFLIGDGVMPSNEGRGYVLRRILRRAVRFGERLGIQGPFLHSLVGVVVREMGEAYVEIRKGQELAERVIMSEEERFLETLSDGMRVAGEMVREVAEGGSSVIPGDKAFVLYDTFGFPLDLTEDLAEEHGLSVDRAGFDKAMAAQRERARAGRAQKMKEHGLSLDGLEATTFVGYDTLAHDSTVLVVFAQGTPGVAQEGEEVLVVLDTTPFYPEGGGQVSDRGQIKTPSGILRVDGVKRSPEDVIVHQGVVETGEIRPGDPAVASVDGAIRANTARNHTATHLIHKGLRTILGGHVNQAGSLVEPSRLRFDFTHFEPVGPERVRSLEDQVNEWVLADLEVSAEEMSIEEAERSGATALFEERYGERVRVISVDGISRELCGGTHVPSTGRIGLVRILGESSVGSGLRRLEAVTGRNVLSLARSREALLEDVASTLRVSPEEVPARVKEMAQRLKAAESEAERLGSRLRRSQVEALAGSALEIEGAKVVAAEIEVPSMEALRESGDLLRNKIGSGVVLIGARIEDKACLVAMVTPDLTGRIHAGALAKVAAVQVGGSGGGRPDMAQAGGKDPERLPKALSEALKAIESSLRGEPLD
jgi:alanyl-tRNA synthetase